MTETALMDTKNHCDKWIKDLSEDLERSKGQSLLVKHGEGKHSLTYDILDKSSGHAIIHVAFMDILDSQGKSKLSNNQDYAVLIHIMDGFWEEIARTKLRSKFKTALQESFKNNKIVLTYRFD